MMLTIREHESGLEEKVAERTRELAAAKKEVTDILDHMAEGIFTVGAQRRVNPAFSASCLQIFGDVPIAGRDVLELLQVDAAAKPETHSRMRFWLDHIIGSDELQWMMVEDQPPRALTYTRPGESSGEAFLELAYAPIYEGDAITKVMVIAKDVTQLRGLESEIKAKDEQHRQSLERVS